MRKAGKLGEGYVRAARGGFAEKIAFAYRVDFLRADVFRVQLGCGKRRARDCCVNLSVLQLFKR